ncbi:hypothetical protein [Bradyrhizobium sp. JYMT SZCCT0180]|uniref:hypothetical protein n=1 Tax=Bradyrhizobium sp. JYMT SZCCT0180 TaxID=2807666 RepID=UPI001BAD082A|nr:hypothetical protein [Bradyrhizobium sp. JYMT SZCCT0180]MBR1212669.1 hypothetical protein [Bradyrhizobium sp. JYMT SZCCT0180]
MTMQSAISGHWSQSMGTELSGQHGMSAAISAISAATGAAMAIPLPAFAGRESGANMSPAITKIASSRERWNDIFTRAFSHVPATKGTSAGSLIRQNTCWKAQAINQSIPSAIRQITSG